jgi:carbamoyltransferase
MGKDVYVLGVSGIIGVSNQYVGHDTSAALLRNGEIVAMAGEERFNRIKKATGTPFRAIQFCLETAGIRFEDLTAIGWGFDPYAARRRWLRKRSRQPMRRIAGVVAEMGRLPGLGALRSATPYVLDPDRLVRLQKYQPRSGLVRLFGAAADKMPFFPVDHHYAHAASAYYASGADDATVVTWDGGGDELSSMICRGHDGTLEVLEEYLVERFSLGVLYQLGHNFLKMPDEGSLMGLAGYGAPKGHFDRNVDVERLRMSVADASCDEFLPALKASLGDPRLDSKPLDDHYRSVAADVQDVIERFGFRIVRHAVGLTGYRRLCCAGGVALNAIMNGKLGRSDLIDEIFMQPNAGDGGTALGAAYVAHQKLGHRIPRQRMEHVYWGKGFTSEEIAETLERIGVAYERVPDGEIPEIVSDLLVAGRVTGWFQGRAEWGPRSLGARSILADPRERAMLQKVNAVIKYRDEWRPFAPSMLEEEAPRYLTGSFYSPFMITTFPVPAERQKDISAVIHVDGTTRPQMVRRAVNPLYYDTIRAFGRKTGVPAVLNTSFNLKGEPIVNSPVDALRTFYSSGMEALLMGNCLVRKKGV